jgi:hypothetical protein
MFEVQDPSAYVFGPSRMDGRPPRGVSLVAKGFKLWETTETRTRMSKLTPKDVYRSEKGSSATCAPTGFEIEKILSDTTAPGA